MLLYAVAIRWDGVSHTNGDKFVYRPLSVTMCPLLNPLLFACVDLGLDIQDEMGRYALEVAVLI